MEKENSNQESIAEIILQWLPFAFFGLIILVVMSETGFKFNLPAFFDFSK